MEVIHVVLKTFISPAKMKSSPVFLQYGHVLLLPKLGVSNLPRARSGVEGPLWIQLRVCGGGSSSMKQLQLGAPGGSSSSGSCCACLWLFCLGTEPFGEGISGFSREHGAGVQVAREVGPEWWQSNWSYISPCSLSCCWWPWSPGSKGPRFCGRLFLPGHAAPSPHFPPTFGCLPVVWIEHLCRLGAACRPYLTPLTKCMGNFSFLFVQLTFLVGMLEQNGFHCFIHLVGLKNV